MRAIFVRSWPLRALLTMAILPSGIAAAQSPASRETLVPAEWTDAGALVSVRAETGKIRFLGAAPGRPIGNAALRDASGLLRPRTASEAARGFLARHGSLFGLRNQGEELTLRSENAAAAGRTVLRFQQVLRGVPVVGGELFVQLNQDQDILSVNGEILSDADVPTAPLVDRAAAQVLAREAVAKRYRIDAANLVATEPELWIYRPSLLGPGVDVTALVWRMDVTPVDLLPIRELVLIDAARGSLALRFNQVPTSRNRETYTAFNGTSLPGTLLCDEGDSTCGDPHANAAHEYARDAYDFYFATHGRDSLDDAGATILSTVHYDFDYFNAFWNGDQLIYGDACSFPLADDVVAHEFTHGVTEFASHLFYYYESGAINESLSDVWGEFVDLTNGAGNDSAAVKWLIGENLSGTGCGPIRNMKTPGAFGDPDRMTSPNFYKGSEDDGGVHRNSGVNNKAVYLMTDGGTFNGKTVTGLGIPKVAKVYYEAQTNLLPSGADYADLYDALNQACSNLVGTAGITASDCQEVRDAADAVEMTKVPTGFSSDAPVCTGVGQPLDLFSDNIDDTGGANFDSIGPLSAWILGNFYASDGTQHMFGDDVFTNANESAQMNLDVALPAGSSPYLRFEHAFGFEDPNFDGGVLEYSTNNGAAWSDAGTLFDYKGYTSTIRLGTGNPLQGRKAFVADSRGYVSSRVKLASLAGNSVRFRWRLGTDGSISDRGWFVDDVRIYTCSGGVLQFGAGFSVGEAGPAATVTVTRTGSTDGTVEVSYATSDGTADALDYTATSGVLTFPSGVASRSFSVPINNDTLDEPNETIHLTLSSPTNFATLGARDTAVLTITDNDSAGTLQLNAASYSVNEAAGTASIVVTRSAGSAGGVEVSYATTDGTAMAGSDYDAASGTLSFGTGETTKSFLVTILNDGIAEGNESFNVVLSNPTGGAVLGPRTSAPVNVLDDEIGLLFDAPNFMVGEAGPAATITVRREGPTAGTVGVSYAASDGTATEGLDYGTSTGTLSLGPGVLSQTFAVPILNDTLVEGSEVLMLSLFNPTGGALLGRYNTAVLTVGDNDPPVLLKLSASSYSVSESSPFATITVARVGSTAGTVGVSYATSDGTATGSDYGAAAGTLSFTPGVKSLTFPVPITGDSSDESNETVSLLLSSPTGGAFLGEPFASVLNILDNDAGGTLQFNLAAYSVNETGGSVMITVTRSMGTASGVSVSYATGDGSATAASDYTATSGMLNFGAGELSKSFAVPILDDAEGEGKEILDITLSGPTGGAVLGSRKKAGLTIVDDDSVSGGTLQLNLAAYNVNEAAGTLTVSVTRSGGAASAVSVDYATTDGSATAGSDYTSTSATLNFGASERTKSFVIPILEDASAEGTETLNLTLSNPTGGALLGRSTAPVSIVDNEAALQFSMANFSVGETGAATILVSRTGSSSSTVGVSYAATSGTAGAGSDFTAVSGTLNFGPGVVSRSFTVPIAKDTLDESNETVNLALSSPTGGIVVGAQGTAVLSISDNDAAGSVQFKSASLNASETGATLTITITRKGGSASGVSVDYASGGGSATPGSDYTAVSGTVSFGAGIMTRTFTLSIANDTLDEINEDLILSLSNPQGGASLGAPSTSMVTIADNDVAGKAQFKIAVQSVSEADSSVSIVVTRSGGTASAATVDFATSDGSATAGSDYTAAAGTLSFDALETTKTFSISLLSDPSDEANETVNLTLSNPGGGLLLGGPSTAVLFIVDNE